MLCYRKYSWCISGAAGWMPLQLNSLSAAAGMWSRSCGQPEHLEQSNEWSFFCLVCMPFLCFMSTWQADHCGTGFVLKPKSLAVTTTWRFCLPSGWIGVLLPQPVARIYRGTSGRDSGRWLSAKAGYGIAFKSLVCDLPQVMLALWCLLSMLIMVNIHL